MNHNTSTSHCVCRVFLDIVKRVSACLATQECHGSKPGRPKYDWRIMKRFRGSQADYWNQKSPNFGWFKFPTEKNSLWFETYVFFLVFFGLLGVYFTIEPYFYSDKTAAWVNPQRAKIVHRKNGNLGMQAFSILLWKFQGGVQTSYSKYSFHTSIWNQSWQKFLNYYGVHPKSLTLSLPPLHLHPILLCYIPSKLPFLRWRWQSQDVNIQLHHFHCWWSEILHQLRLVVYPIIYRVVDIPGGAGSFPSTVWFLASNCCIFPNSQFCHSICAQKTCFIWRSFEPRSKNPGPYFPLNPACFIGIQKNNGFVSV